ncbi:MAG: phosphate acyltransferase PlsX [Bacillota bacterium]|nr:phosphate acyltransferase PlsX [Bacillota bacterium]NLJ02107.1 phosphate acyltransferase PlsX [Bacillota bacterium]
MVKIAVDAFGGDYAPEQIVKGALQAAEQDGIRVILTGNETRLKSLVNGKPGSELIEIVHAPEVIQMDEAAEAVRSKPNSSLVQAARLVKEGEAGALVSAGSTGATMAAAVLTIRRIKGVERPAITSLMPTRTGVALMVDVGANVDCKPGQLLQFAQMGSIYAENVLRIHRPRVGLLNIGHEPTKGNSLSKEVYTLLQDAGVNFVGNIEGRDISAGHCDVVVCDGFVGNVVLKFAEGLADALFGMMKEEFTSSIPAKLGALLLEPGLRSIKKKVDYTEYGGAPLLGVNGVVIIAHGGSNAKAIYNAIRVAKEGVQQNIVQGIAERMAT